MISKKGANIRGLFKAIWSFPDVKVILAEGTAIQNYGILRYYKECSLSLSRQEGFTIFPFQCDIGKNRATPPRKDE